MGLDPGSIITAIFGIFEQRAMGKIEQQAAHAGASALATFLITFLWEQGDAIKWWQSEGEALKMGAVSLYLTMQRFEEQGLLTLTVPTELLADANRKAKFNTIGVIPK